jgi:fatty acid desaturase
MATLLSKEDIHELSRIQHGRLWLSYTLWWVLMLGLIQLCISVALWWVWAPSILLMGCLQNGLILWSHEAAHCNLSRRKALNDALGDLLMAGPIGITLDGYRWHHMPHHKYLGDPTREPEKSPYTCVRGGQLWVHLARHLFGLVALRVIFRREYHSGDTPFAPPPPRSLWAWAGFLVFNGALFALCFFQGAWPVYFALWAVPLFSLATLVSNSRTIVEHQPSSDVCDSGEQVVPAISRTVDANIVERFLVAPVGFYYHYEHHLYPGIPYSRLPEVRCRLQALGHYDEVKLVRSKGFIRTLWRLSREPGFQIPFIDRTG